MRRQNEMCFELLRHALPAAAASENGSCGGGSAEGVGVNSSAPLVQLPSSENAGVFRSSLFSALHYCTAHTPYTVLCSRTVLHRTYTVHIIVLIRLLISLLLNCIYGRS